MYPRVSVHLKTDSKHKIKAIVIPILNESCFTALHRSLISHGIQVSDIARREMRLSEIEDEHSRKRVHWYPYESWEYLIYEEYNITKDLTWCTELLTHSRLDHTLQEALEIGKNLSSSGNEIKKNDEDNPGKVPTVLQGK